MLLSLHSGQRGSTWRSSRFAETFFVQNRYRPGIRQASRCWSGSAAPGLRKLDEQLPHAVLWSWAFCVKTSPEVWPWSLTLLPLSSTAMTRPPTKTDEAGGDCGLTGVLAPTGTDAIAVSALPGEAALNNVTVAMVAAPAKITCATDRLFVMNHMKRLFTSSSIGRYRSAVSSHRHRFGPTVTPWEQRARVGQ